MADYVLAHLRLNLVCQPDLLPLGNASTDGWARNRIILPILGEFVDSGYRDSRNRLLYSLRSNARYHATVFACGVVGLIYVSIQNGFEFSSIRALVMALAYVWGLVLAIYLMGHGLVSIPRTFWRQANNAESLRRLQVHALKVHDRLTDAITDLEELEAKLRELQRRKTGSAAAFEDWINELAEYSDHSESHAHPLRPAGPVNVPAVITERYMADLSRRLQRARHQKARFVSEWHHLVQSAARYQAILNSSASQKLDFNQLRSDGLSSPMQSSLVTPYLRYHIYVHVLPAVRLLLAAVCAAASFCVVWSELIKTIAPRYSIISLSLVPRPDDQGQVGFGGQVLSALWLLYMCSAALKGVHDAQVWGNRALVRRNTYGESACWYAGQVARLTVPLSYNFVTFLPGDIHRGTIFYHFLGQYIDLTPLGKGFDYFFPVLVLFPVCATMFNLYGRIKRALGLSVVEDDDEGEAMPGDYGTGGWREGRALIERELNGLGSLGIASGVSPTTSVAGTNDLSPVRRGARGQRTPPAAGSSRRPAVPLSASSDSDSDENVFQSFAHRVRNTFETASTPRWLQGDFSGLRPPRWMSSEPGGQSPPSRGGGGFLDRVFGGRSTQGYSRL